MLLFLNILKNFGWQNMGGAIECIVWDQAPRHDIYFNEKEKTKNK